MIKYWNKKIKKLNVWDIGMMKLNAAIFILFLITIWPAAMAWVHSVNPWYFLIAFVILAIRPVYRIYFKK